MWVRGSSPVTYSDPDDRGVRHHQSPDPERYAHPGEVMLRLLRRAGIQVSHDLRGPASGRVVQAIHRHDNAYWFSGYLPDTTTSVRLRLPGGAPLLQQREAWMEEGVSVHQLPKSFHVECRVLVDQAAAGVVKCRDVAPFPAFMTRGISVSGLSNARVTVLLPRRTGAVEATVAGHVVDLNAAPEPGGAVTWRRDGQDVIVDGLTGEITIMWEERR